jgi:hypothetical protein
MPALVKDPKKRWPGKVPYVIGNLAKPGEENGKFPPITEENFRKSLDEFNAAVGADVFVPRTDQTNYVEFVYGVNSPIGMQGGPQQCKITRLNAYHEMGHAIGLAHPYFHTRSRLPPLLNGVDKQSYDLKRWDLVDYMDPNFPSMMGYTPNVFANSPRLVRVVDQIGQLQIDVGERCDAAKMRAQKKLSEKKKGDTRVPENSKKTKKTKKIDPYAFPRKLEGNIDKMTQAELEQLLEDLDIVKEYWTFEEGFEMKVHPIDKNAVRHVLGLRQQWTNIGHTRWER